LGHSEQGRAPSSLQCSDEVREAWLSIPPNSVNVLQRDVSTSLDMTTSSCLASLDVTVMNPHPYFFIVIFIGVALVFPLVPLALAWLWRRFFQPAKPGPDKTSTYECGVESIGDAQIQFHAQYYLYAIIFLIFDVEAVFLIPFAVAFTGLPIGAFIAILVFLLLLIEGLIWAWGKGCLQWQR
jgi:NADH-quinone oxidoreductase subunit A